jgi:VLTF3-like late transcription factor
MSELPVSYKTKPDKHKYRRRNKSLDEVHNDHVRQFQKNHDRVPHLEEKLSKMETELHSILKSGITNMDTELTNRKSTLRAKIKQLKRELDTYKNYEDELEYFSRAGDVLFEYYEETNGAFYNNVYEDIDAPEEVDKSKIQISDALYKLNASNRKKRKRQPRKRPTVSTRPQSNGIMAMLFGGEKKAQSKEDIQNIKCRARLEDQYLTIVDKEYTKGLKNIPITRCPECDTERLVIHAESLLVCPNPECAMAEEIMIEAEVPSQRENYNEKTKYPYKRLAHFVEKLNQFLCKGTVNIPDKVYDAIYSEMHKYSFTEENITIKFLENSLKKHDLSTYYEYTMYIYCKIKKVEPLTIKRDEYDAMIKMFQKMDEIYEEYYKPDDRSNFLRYTVAMYRLFLILGKVEHANTLKLLKDTEKMKEQFKIIDKIFDHLGWEYDSTYHNISQVSGGSSRIISSRSKHNYQSRSNYLNKQRRKKDRTKSKSTSKDSLNGRKRMRRVRRVRKSPNTSLSNDTDEDNVTYSKSDDNIQEDNNRDLKRTTRSKTRHELCV